MATRKIIKKEQAEVKAAIYLRVSTEDQADSGLGIAAQRARCYTMAMSKGWTNITEYVDEGISGKLDHTKRLGLAAMLTAIEQGQINTVIVLDTSRLSRIAQLTLRYQDFFKNHNVTYLSCKDTVELQGAMGTAMNGFIAVLNQLERDLIAERTVAALAERKKQYGYASGKIATGYTRNAGTETISIDASSAQIVIQVFQKREQGYTMRAIAADMALATGNKWYASTVKCILDNESKYKGLELGYPAII